MGNHTTRITKNDVVIIVQIGYHLISGLFIHTDLEQNNFLYKIGHTIC